MSIFKFLLDGDEYDEEFDSYEDAEEGALQAISDWHTGTEILEMSNPGDYPYDPDDAPEYEIIEVDN